MGRGSWIALGLGCVGVGAILYFVEPIDAGSQTPTLQPVTADEASRFGQDFAGALASCRRPMLAAMMDQPHLVMRAADRVGLQGAERVGFVTGAGFNTITDGLCEPGDERQVTLLRVRDVDGQPAPLLRVLGDDGLNYLQFTLTKDARGETRAVDIYPFAAGEPMSAAMAGLARGTMAEGPLAGFTLEQAIDRVDRAASAGDHAEAIRMLDEMPENVRTTKAIQLKRLQLAANVGGIDYASAIADFERRFPDDPALAMVSLDGLSMRGDWVGAAAQVARIEALVGGDPHLGGMRASLLMKAGRDDDGLTLARTTLSAAPDTTSAWDALVMGLAHKGEFAGIAKAIEEMRTRLQLDITADGLAGLDYMAPFLASPEGKAWAAAH